MEYYVFGGCLLLLSITAILALKQVAQVAKAAIEAVKAKNLMELAEVEHERAKNQVDLQAIIDANRKAWKQKQAKACTPEDPETAAFGARIVTDVDGRKYHTDELEVL
jgi:hypothetical protein